MSGATFLEDTYAAIDAEFAESVKGKGDSWSQEKKERENGKYHVAVNGTKLGSGETTSHQGFLWKLRE